MEKGRWRRVKMGGTMPTRATRATGTVWAWTQGFRPLRCRVRGRRSLYVDRMLGNCKSRCFCTLKSELTHFRCGWRPYSRATSHSRRARSSCSRTSGATPSRSRIHESCLSGQLLSLEELLEERGVHDHQHHGHATGSGACEGSCSAANVAETMSATAARAPVPVSPHASVLTTGITIWTLPKLWRVVSCGRVKGCCHMCEFIAGATTVRLSRVHALATHVKRLSQSPFESLASVLAESGATTNTSAHLHNWGRARLSS